MMIVCALRSGFYLVCVSLCSGVSYVWLMPWVGPLSVESLG